VILPVVFFQTTGGRLAGESQSPHWRVAA